MQTHTQMQMQRQRQLSFRTATGTAVLSSFPAAVATGPAQHAPAISDPSSATTSNLSAFVAAVAGVTHGHCRRNRHKLAMSRIQTGVRSPACERRAVGTAEEACAQLCDLLSEKRRIGRSSKKLQRLLCGLGFSTRRELIDFVRPYARFELTKKYLRLVGPKPNLKPKPEPEPKPEPKGAAEAEAGKDKATKYLYTSSWLEFDAVANLLRRDEKVIAVDLEGHLVTDSQVSLIQMATLKGNCFILDMHAAGEAQGFQGAELKKLLEAPDVLKVLHDCRQDAYALDRACGIRLERVFDTQVGWALLFPEDTRRPGLNVVLQKFGGRKAVNELKTSVGSSMDVQHALNLTSTEEERAGSSIWDTRPLPAELLEYAAKDVISLAKAAVKMMTMIPPEAAGELRVKTDMQLAAYRDEGTSAFSGLRVGHRTAFHFKRGTGSPVLAPGDLTETAASARASIGERREEVLKMLAVLPEGLQEAVEPYAQDLVDLALDLGRVPTMRLRRHTGGLHELDLFQQPMVTTELIEGVSERVGPFDEQRRGGIDGTLHRVSFLPGKRVPRAGLSLRAGFATSAALSLIRDVVTMRESFLLLGPPGVGKTTMLRAVCEHHSTDSAVLIVESSDEIAGAGDICHHSVGRARRFRAAGRGQRRHEAMLQAVENHTPSFLVVDEIGTREEAKTARSIAARGVRLIGTAHGHALEDIMQNDELADLLGGRHGVILANTDPRYRGIAKTVQERLREPVFEVLVELRSPTCAAVYRELPEAIDMVLEGRRPLAEVRELDPESGELFITKDT